ncbi:MAG: hypothetical protein JWN95_1198 [Frankiales bacterium]|nr:hypothetical protein [Frankiales bacterium]
MDATPTPAPVPMPMPEMLDPNRPSLKARLEMADVAERVRLLAESLEKVSVYGQLLWHDVDALRQYLLASAPSDPYLPGPHRVGASPTGPDDQEGWNNWIAAYAEATSVLAGPHGDSGFGLREARHEEQIRRSAPDVLLQAKLRLYSPPA